MPWLGKYNSRGCDSTRCCCATVVDITPSFSSSDYTVTGSSLLGACGVQTSVVYTFPIPTFDTVYYTFEGQRHTATRTPTGGITDFNSNSPACNAVLTKILTISAAPVQSTLSPAFIAIGAVIAAVLAHL